MKDKATQTLLLSPRPWKRSCLELWVSREEPDTALSPVWEGIVATEAEGEEQSSDDSVSGGEWQSRKGRKSVYTKRYQHHLVFFAVLMN